MDGVGSQSIKTELLPPKVGDFVSGQTEEGEIIAGQLQVAHRKDSEFTFQGVDKVIPEFYLVADQLGQLHKCLKIEFSELAREEFLDPREAARLVLWEKYGIEISYAQDPDNRKRLNVGLMVSKVREVTEVTSWLTDKRIMMLYVGGSTNPFTRQVEEGFHLVLGRMPLPLDFNTTKRWFVKEESRHYMLYAFNIDPTSFKLIDEGGDLEFTLAQVGNGVEEALSEEA